MTHKETVQRNIGLTFDFVGYLIDNPMGVEKLPADFKLAFKEKDFPQMEYQQPAHLTSREIEKKYVRVKNTFAVA
jgi:hypothetical protein